LSEPLVTLTRAFCKRTTITRDRKSKW